jgi:hypothetical protein
MQWLSGGKKANGRRRIAMLRLYLSITSIATNTNERLQDACRRDMLLQESDLTAALPQTTGKWNLPSVISAYSKMGAICFRRCRMLLPVTSHRSLVAR